MSNLNKAVLKVAQSNPAFAQALKAELGKTNKTAKSLRLPTKDGSKATFSLDKNPGVYAHVWFDKDVAQTDFGQRAPHSGEWQVILSTSEDPLNQRPRGRELGRKVFRYVEKKTEGQVYGAAKDYILRQLSQRRRLAETKTANTQIQRALQDSFRGAYKNAEKLLVNEPEKVAQRIQQFEKYTKESYARLIKTIEGFQKGQSTWGISFVADRLDTYFQQRAYLDTLKAGL